MLFDYSSISLCTDEVLNFTYIYIYIHSYILSYMKGRLYSLYLNGREID